MAAIMEIDTSLWLHNKLGNDDNLWSTGGIASQFNRVVLQNISHCFLQLETRIKIKTLLSFLEIPLRNIKGFQELIINIVNIAESDPDEWVKVAARVVKDYPVQPVIDKKLGSVIPLFQETLNEVVTKVVDVDKSKLSYLLPRQCQYLNQTALSHIVPETVAPPKHFTLRRIPKSAALRAKITQKASEAASHRRLSQSLNNQPSSKANLKRSNSLSVPVPHSKMSINKLSSLPKKTKLLDIADQPLGVREQKKRKKILAMEAHLEEAKLRKQAKDRNKHAKDRSDDKDNSTQGDTQDAVSGNEDEINEHEGDPATIKEDDEDDEDDEEEDATTEPAAAAASSTVNTTPSYAVIPGTSNSQPGLNTPSKLETQQFPFASQPLTTPNLSDPLLQRGTDIYNLVNVDPSASLVTQNFQREIQMRVQQEHELRIHQEQQQQRFNQQLFQQQQQMQSFQQQQGLSNMSLGGQSALPQMSRQLPPMNMASVTPPVATPQQPNQRKKDLFLPRDKRIAAQEMFKFANCVKRPEKALILGFMAGDRENPFPQQGPVITIKLSQDTETIPATQQPDGTTTLPQTMIIEMLFEMNYDTGLWKRLRRTRVVSQQKPTS